MLVVVNIYYRLQIYRLDLCIHVCFATCRVIYCSVAMSPQMWLCSLRHGLASSVSKSYTEEEKKEEGKQTDGQYQAFWVH